VAIFKRIFRIFFCSKAVFGKFYFTFSNNLHAPPRVKSYPVVVNIVVTVVAVVKTVLAPENLSLFLRLRDVPLTKSLCSINFAL